MCSSQKNISAKLPKRNLFLFERRELYGFFPPMEHWWLWLFTQPIYVWAFGYIIRPLNISACVSDFATPIPASQIDQDGKQIPPDKEPAILNGNRRP